MNHTPGREVSPGPLIPHCIFIEVACYQKESVVLIVHFTYFVLVNKALIRAPKQKIQVAKRVE